MIGLELNHETGAIDIAFDGGLLEEDSFVSDVLISLFTDMRAPDYSDLAPEDRRGWWADANWGSRIWQFMRRPFTPETVTLLRKAVVESLAWMVDAEILKSVTVAATRESRDTVKLAVELARGDGKRWEVTWSMTSERLVALAVRGPYA